MAEEERDIFEGFDPMAEDYVQKLNSSYFGGPGFALPDSPTSTKPLNILVEKIPEGLKKEGIVRAFKLAKVLPISCKLFNLNGANKAVVLVKTITDATNAIQALNDKKPLNLKVTLVVDRKDYVVKKNSIMMEQREALTKHLSTLAQPVAEIGETVNNLCAVEHLFKILSSADDVCQICSDEPLIRHVHFIVSEEKVIDPFRNIPASMPISCVYCDRKEGQFIVCSICQITIYCGLRCQTLDSVNHRKVCSPHPKLSNGDSNGDQVKEKNPKVLAVAKKAEIEKQSIPPKVKIPSEPKQEKAHQEIVIHEPIEKPAPIQEKPKEAPAVKENPPQTKPPSPKIPISNNNGCKSHENVPINPANYIVEPNKIVRPRKKISLNNEVEHIRETKLPINEVTEVIFAYCYGPNDFYVQRLADLTEAESMTAKLMQACPAMKDWPEANKLSSGNYCSAKYEDGCWYRAKVIGSRNDEVEVQFIDYGNYEIVPFTALRPLPPELVAIPALAVRCALKFVKPLFETGWSNEASKFFEDCFDDNVEFPYTQCKVFNESDGIHHVVISNENGEKINDLLVQNGFAVHYEEHRKPIIRRNPNLRGPSTDAHSSNETGQNGRKPETKAPVDSPPQVKKPLSPTEALEQVSFKDSPSQFYGTYAQASLSGKSGIITYRDEDDPSVIYVLCNNDALLNMSMKIITHKKSKEGLELKRGIFCISKAGEDEYYRCLILYAENEEQSRVFYLDFGNIDTVENSNLYNLPKEFGLEKIPALAIRCRLVNIEKFKNAAEEIDKLITAGNPVKIKHIRQNSEYEHSIELLP